MLSTHCPVTTHPFLAGAGAATALPFACVQLGAVARGLCCVQGLLALARPAPAGAQARAVSHAPGRASGRACRQPPCGCALASWLGACGDVPFGQQAAGSSGRQQCRGATASHDLSAGLVDQGSGSPSVYRITGSPVQMLPCCGAVLLTHRFGGPGVQRPRGHQGSLAALLVLLHVSRERACCWCATVLLQAQEALARAQAREPPLLRGASAPHRAPLRAAAAEAALACWAAMR